MRCHVCLLLVSCAALAQVTPDPKLRANRNTYHPVMEVLRAKRTPVSDEQLDRLKTFPLEAMWGALSSLGYTSSHFSGLKSTRPHEVLVGRALTMRYLPKRPDIQEAMRTLAAEGDWPQAYYVRAGDEAKPGDVLVVDLGGGVSDGIFFGDISALGAKMAGARGAVIYGSSRDFTELQQLEGFPVLAMGFDPRPTTQTAVDWNIPIRIGSATVLPGDVVVADAEAVLFFPPQLAGKVIELASQTVEQEAYKRKLIMRKQHRFRDVYPLSPELRKQFEAERKKR